MCNTDHYLRIYLLGFFTAFVCCFLKLTWIFATKSLEKLLALTLLETPERWQNTVKKWLLLSTKRMAELLISHSIFFFFFFFFQAALMMLRGKPAALHKANLAGKKKNACTSCLWPGPRVKMQIASCGNWTSQEVSCAVHFYVFCKFVLRQRTYLLIVQSFHGTKKWLIDNNEMRVYMGIKGTGNLPFLFPC